MPDQHTPPAAASDAAAAPRPPALPEFAALDPDCALAPGLFRSLPKGEAARKHRLEVVYDSRRDGVKVTFLSPDLLGADDLRVLQGVMALVTKEAADEGVLQINRPRDVEGVQLVLGFEAKDDLENQVAMRLHGSYRDLARAVGLDPLAGGTVKQIQRSLKRLCMVGVLLDGPGVRGAVHLMAGLWKKRVAGGGGSGDLRLALNPRLADIALAGLGEVGEKYIRIDLQEVRALRTNAARLIHQRLCAFINPGMAGRVRLDTLCGYVWPERTDNPRAVRQRRATARRGLRELQRFGRPWTVAEYGPGRFEIGRPARPEADVLDGGAE